VAARKRTTASPSSGGTAPRRSRRRRPTPEGQAAGAALLEDERRFIDLARSPLFVAVERPDNRVTVPLFVPGRLCLFGEHSDWAGAYRATHPALSPGRCLVAGTDQGLQATADPSDAVELSSVLPDGSRVASPPLVASEKALDAVARGGGFFSYAAGVAAEIVVRFGPRGVRLDVTADDLPLGKGSRRRPRSASSSRARSIASTASGSRRATRWSWPTPASDARGRSAASWIRCAPTAARRRRSRSTAPASTSRALRSARRSTC
jgi:hypothetical protein